MADDDHMAARDAHIDALSSIWRDANLQRRLDMQVEAYWAEKRVRHGNPLVAAGEKYFSQSDEDGIVLEICRRLGLDGGVALEFGVGNGFENNSLILLLAGWTVGWVGGEALAFGIPTGCSNLRFVRDWVTAENCVALGKAAIGSASLDGIDMLSVDLDGNDIYVLDALLRAGARPRVLIVEYNAKFPPPVRWQIAYDPGHVWDGSDYQGASLQSFVDLAAGYDYRLVACNITGTNAFFVRTEEAAAFADVPSDVKQLFVPADFNWFVERGHRVSSRTIECVLRVDPASRTSPPGDLD